MRLLIESIQQALTGSELSRLIARHQRPVALPVTVHYAAWPHLARDAQHLVALRHGALGAALLPATTPATAALHELVGGDPCRLRELPPAINLLRPRSLPTKTAVQVHRCLTIYHRFIDSMCSDRRDVLCSAHAMHALEYLFCQQLPLHLPAYARARSKGKGKAADDTATGAGQERRRRSTLAFMPASHRPAASTTPSHVVDSEDTAFTQGLTLVIQRGALLKLYELLLRYLALWQHVCFRNGSMGGRYGSDQEWGNGLCVDEAVTSRAITVASALAIADSLTRCSVSLGPSAPMTLALNGNA